MPLGTRDILLVIRAKDQASRVIRDVGLAFDNVGKSAEQAALRTMRTGAALVGIGVGLTAVGAKGLSVLYDWTKQAQEYNRTAALTLTQVDQLGVSVNDIADIGLRVASSIAAPLKELQPALYDIFSSMDVSVAEAEVILRSFAKTSVAGQVDVQTAGRQTIAVMNGLGLGTKDLGMIQDVTFQLVRKGVGTYEQFASTIGRAIPSTKRADQSYQTLAGTLAFLTRNGLSTAMASTTAARAMDTLANPKFQQHLEGIGISAFDASGKFRPLNDVATDLGKTLAGLTDKQKAQALADLFQGAGGTIQSRRFWDLAINHFDELNQRVDEMVNSSGALDKAYQIMFDTPATKAQQLRNNWDVFKIKIGDALIPVLQQMYDIGIKVTDWLNSLDGSTLTAIARFAALGFAILTVVGILITLVGLFALFWGAISLIGGLGAVIGILATLGFWLLALAAAAYVIYRNWGTISDWWKNTLWPGIKAAAEAVINWMRDNVPGIWQKIKDIAMDVWPKIQSAIETAASAIATAWEALKKKAEEWWPAIKQTAVDAINGIKDAAQSLHDNWPQIWDDIKTKTSDWATATNDFIQTVWQKLQSFWDFMTGYFGPGIQHIWEAIRDNAGPIWDDIVIIVTKALQAIALALAAAYAELTLIWQNIHTGLRTIADTAWSFIYNLIANYLLLIRGYLDVIAGLLTLDWARVHQGLQEITQAAWNAIQNIIQTAMGLILGVVQIGLGLMYTQAQMTWALMQAAASVAWNAIKAAIGAAIAAIVADVQAKLGAIAAFWSAEWNLMVSVATSVWNAIKSAVQTGMAAVQTAINGAIAAVKSIWSSFWNSLPGPVRTAAGIVAGLAGTIASAISGIVSGVSGMVSSVQSGANAAISAINTVRNAASVAINPLNLPIPGLHRAAGGPVLANMLTVVGERGPEFFVPNTDGFVFPNSAFRKVEGIVTGMARIPGGGAGGPSITLNFYGPTEGSQVQEIVRQEFRSLATTMRRNG